MNIVDFETFFGEQEPRFYKSDRWLIYFLLDNTGEIVYVGKSSLSGIFSRLSSHWQDKIFNGYFFVYSHASEKGTYDLERSFITLIKPIYNKNSIYDKRGSLVAMFKWMKKVELNDRVEDVVQFRKYGLLPDIEDEDSLITNDQTYDLDASKYEKLKILFTTNNYSVPKFIASMVCINFGFIAIGFSSKESFIVTLSISSLCITMIGIVRVYLKLKNIIELKQEME